MIPSVILQVLPRDIPIHSFGTSEHINKHVLCYHYYQSIPASSTLVPDADARLFGAVVCNDVFVMQDIH